MFQCEFTDINQEGPKKRERALKGLGVEGGYRWAMYRGSVLRRTACPYPGTTRPLFNVAQIYSLIVSSDTFVPTSSFICIIHLNTSWLARPCSGPARPFNPAARDNIGLDKAEPT